MYLFIHIPRTAGTTFSHILKRNFKDKYVRIYGMKKIDFFSDEEVMALATFFPDAECISSHKFVCPIPQPDNSNTNKIIDYKLITFLRDPVTRAFSHYSFSRMRWEKSKDKESTEFPFEEYFKKNVKKGKRQSNERWTYLADMQTYILDRNFDMEVAKKRMREMFFIGVSERFEESLLILRKNFKKQGIDFKINYFKKNVSKNRKLGLSLETYNMVLEKNKRDKELHNYANELLDEAIKNYGGDFKKDLTNFKRKQNIMKYLAGFDEIYSKILRFCLKILNKLIY